MADSDNLYWRTMLTKTIRSLWVDTSPERVMTRARRYLEKGRPDSAAGVLRDALAAGGEESTLRMELSRILITMNQVRQAADGLKSFLKARPSEASHLQELLEWARANHHEAQSLNEVLAEHYVGRRELRLAFEALEKVGKEGLGALLAARLSHLNKFLEKQPGTVPRTALPLVYLAALIHEALGEDPKAIDVYHRIVAAHPGELTAIEERLRGITARHYRSGSLRAVLAAIYVTAGDRARAVAEYVSMAEVDPRSAPQAAEALREIAVSPDAPPSALMGLVKVLRGGGDREALAAACRDLLHRGGPAAELLEVLEAMAVEGRQEPAMQLLLGEAAEQAGKISRAVNAYSAAFDEAAPEVTAQARAALERMIEQHPEEIRAAETLADLAVREGRHDDAVGCLEKIAGIGESASRVASRLQAILISAPGHPGAYALLERIAPALHDPQLAILFLRRRLREGPDAAKEALEKIDRIMARSSGDPFVRMAAVEGRASSGDMAGAWKLLQPLLDGTTGPDPALLHLMVLIGGSSAELCAAISDRFCTMAPALAETPEGQFCLGEMAGRSGDAETALERLRSAAGFSESAAREVLAAAREFCGEKPTGRAAGALAELFVDVGNFAGAASVLSAVEGLGPESGRILDKIERAHRANPEDSDRRLALAAALAAAGRTAHARQLIDEGIQRAGASAPGPLHLAAGDAWLRDGNLAEAVRSYSKAMAQDKSLAGESVRRLEKVLYMDVGNAAAHLARGRGLLLDGNPREGVNALLTAWSIKPSAGTAIMKDLAYAARAFPLEPGVDLARAQICLGQGDVEAATASLGAALRASPTMAPEVLARLQAIVSSHPSCGPAHLHSARAWRLRGRFHEAGEEYLSAFEIDAKLVDHVASGIADLLTSFPAAPDPQIARARLEEARGNASMAAEAWEAAALRGADPTLTTTSLSRLAKKAGPHRGRALLALARASRQMKLPAQAAQALLDASQSSPERLAEAREEAERLAESFPKEAAPRLAKARILISSLEPVQALPEVEAALDSDPSSWAQVAELVQSIASAGADPARCALISARALAAGGDLESAAAQLGPWSSSAEGGQRAKMCLVMARIERRRGNLLESRRWMDEASAAAPDRQAFLVSHLEETRAAALAAVRTRGSAADRWKALRALLDLGDAEGAARLAGEMGLAREAQEEGGNGRRDSAREVLARISCLQGRYGEGARLLEQVPPSELKGHVLRRAGRLVEAAACLEEACGAEAGPGLPAHAIYRRLAAAEFLREPGCLEAETRLDFSAGTAEPADSGKGEPC